MNTRAQKAAATALLSSTRSTGASPATPAAGSVPHPPPPVPQASGQHSGGNDNHAFQTFLAARDSVLRLTCPYTSQQNGRAERILRTLNDCVRTMLLHAAMPLRFWPDTLQTATHLINRRPCTPRGHATPHLLLFGVQPD